LVPEHAVLAELGRSRDVTGAARQFVRIVCAEQGWACGACWIAESATGDLACAGTWGSADLAIEVFLAATRALQSPALDPCVRDSLASGTAASADTLASIVGTRAPLASAAGLRSAVVIPVAADGRRLGFVEFFDRGANEPDAGFSACAAFIGEALGQFCARAQAEARLWETAELFSNTVELAAIGIAHVDADGRYTYANGWLCDLLGYTREELLGLTVKQISHPGDRNVTDEVRARLRSGAIPFFQIEKRYLRKNGTPVWVACRRG
jgi:PAS domain S-box-containing protein